MRTLLLACAALAAMHLGCSGPREVPRLSLEAPDLQMARAIEDVAEGLSKQDQFSGVVVVSRRGQPLVRRAFGFAERAKQRPNTADTAFALASVSKMFTAVAVTRLVERKRLSLDATIGSLLPAYPDGPGRSQVTVRHLLMMSSGIPDLFQVPTFWASIERIKVPSDFWPFFARAPLSFPPGSKWTYSNSNFLILGAIIEQVTGRPFAAVVEEQVFKPAGMTRITYRSSTVPNSAIGYTRTRPAGAAAAADGWYPAWEDPAAQSTAGSDSADFVVGAPMGGGVATADDLVRFAEALMGGRLLSGEMTAEVLTGRLAADYGGQDGYGFETRETNGIRSAGHRGGFTGTTNLMEFYPDLGYVVVILGNTDAKGTEAIANDVRRRIVAAHAPHAERAK